MIGPSSLLDQRKDLRPEKVGYLYEILKLSNRARIQTQVAWLQFSAKDSFDLDLLGGRAGLEKNWK